MKTLQILVISALIGVTMSVLMQFPFASSDSGSLIGFSARSPDLSNMSLVLYDKFDQVSPNSTKDLYLEFFDEKNKTLVKNISFFVNATKDDTILIHELFFTHTGIMTLQFSPGSDTGKWVINGTAEPVLGGMMSNNDILPIEMSAFTPGTYHFHIEVLALVYTNGIVDQTNPPTFDSWWSVDDKGNISKYVNSTTVSKIKNTSPLQQFKSGIAAKDVECNDDLQLIFKTEGNFPTCVKTNSAFHLSGLGWGYLPSPFIIKTDLLNSTISGGKIKELQYDIQSRSIIIKIQTTSDGSLMVTIPKFITDLNPSDKPFKDFHTVLDDGMEENVDLVPTANGSSFTIPFVNGTQEIEIMGNYVGMQR